MACQFCTAGSPRELGPDNKWVHSFKRAEKRYCEDNATQDDTPRMSDIERQNLYDMVEIASRIRMRHDVSFYDALDWVRELFKEANAPYPVGFPRQRVVDTLLLRHNHVCTAACEKAKDIE
jgi:hypothetical protein